jgi:hypothetical protein
MIQKTSQPTRGQVIDYRSPSSRPTSRFTYTIEQWFARPSKALTITVVMIVCGLVLWWSRTPAADIGETVGRNVSIALIAVPAFVRVMGWAYCKFSAGSTNVRGSLRMVSFGLLVITSAILVFSDGALELAFSASKPAMDRLAAFAAANPSAPLPDRWVGLYYAKDIRRVGGGICFRVHGDRSEGSGFANGSLDASSASLPGETPFLFSEFHPPWSTWNTNW